MTIRTRIGALSLTVLLAACGGKPAAEAVLMHVGCPNPPALTTLELAAMS